MAYYVGTYTYTTVNGSSRTIRKLDYGIPCDPPAELVKQQIEAAKAQEILEKKKTEEAKSKALQWNRDQAAKGDPYGLLRKVRPHLKLAAECCNDFPQRRNLHIGLVFQF